MSASFFALLDDIAMMGKSAMSKTVGVMGDDLALNAEQVTGIRPARELPVVWEITKGSLINKIILIPVILALSYFYPPLITILLFIGGSYLCYEGVEAIIERVFHSKEYTDKSKEHVEVVKKLSKTDLLRLERAKIKGAIKTDFVLSGELLVIALSALEAFGKSFLSKSIALFAVGIVVTILIYGLLAIIIKMDDVGMWLKTKKNAAAIKMGDFLLWLMPNFLNVLSVVGLVAMLMVGGSIVIHSLPFMHFTTDWLNTFSGISKTLVTIGHDFVAGLIAGMIIVPVITIVMKFIPKKEK